MRNEKTKNLADHYWQKLTGTVNGQAENLNGREADNVQGKSIDVNSKLDASRGQLNKIVEEYLGNDPELKKIADKIVKKASDPLKAVAEGNNQFLENHPESTQYLEVIVCTDGSRPSFMIRDGKPDGQTSPAGDWLDMIEASGDRLLSAIDCVGRINVDGQHVGTGFMVQQNYILTNRHVLQAIATKENDGSWYILPNTTINFGHEFRARQSVRERKLSKLIFCGDKYIERFRIDHSKLDMALIELEPSANNSEVPFLSISTATDWAATDTDTFVYIIGYPGNPGLDGVRIYRDLLEQLFKSTYGCKRLAPGKVISSMAAIAPWTVAHDSTTLGGNSGSVVITFGKETTAAGIHYGGTTGSPRENWGHILGKTLDSTNGQSSKTLREHLQQYEVRLIDPFRA